MFWANWPHNWAPQSSETRTCHAYMQQWLLNDDLSDRYADIIAMQDLAVFEFLTNLIAALSKLMLWENVL